MYLIDYVTSPPFEKGGFRGIKLAMKAPSPTGRGRGMRALDVSQVFEFGNGGYFFDGHYLIYR